MEAGIDAGEPTPPEKPGSGTPEYAHSSPLKNLGPGMPAHWGSTIPEHMNSCLQEKKCIGMAATVHVDSPENAGSSMFESTNLGIQDYANPVQLVGNSECILAPADQNKPGNSAESIGSEQAHPQIHQVIFPIQSGKFFCF
jgi:hypothetical protein